MQPETLGINVEKQIAHYYAGNPQLRVNGLMPKPDAADILESPATPYSEEMNKKINSSSIKIMNGVFSNWQEEVMSTEETLDELGFWENLENGSNLVGISHNSWFDVGLFLAQLHEVAKKKEFQNIGENITTLVGPSMRYSELPNLYELGKRALKQLPNIYNGGSYPSLDVLTEIYKMGDASPEQWLSGFTNTHLTIPHFDMTPERLGKPEYEEYTRKVNYQSVKKILSVLKKPGNIMVISLPGSNPIKLGYANVIRQIPDAISQIFTNRGAMYVSVSTERTLSTENLNKNRLTLAYSDSLETGKGKDLNYPPNFLAALISASNIALGLPPAVYSGSIDTNLAQL